MKLFFLLTFLLTACTTTTSSHGSKINGVVFLSKSEKYLTECESLGSIQGIPSSVWGGKIGNSQARIDALKQAKSLGATHFEETQSNWTDGNVSGNAYKCESKIE